MLLMTSAYCKVSPPTSSHVWTVHGTSTSNKTVNKSTSPRRSIVRQVQLNHLKTEQAKLLILVKYLDNNMEPDIPDKYVKPSVEAALKKLLSLDQNASQYFHSHVVYFLQCYKQMWPTACCLHVLKYHCITYHFANHKTLG